MELGDAVERAADRREADRVPPARTSTQTRESRSHSGRSAQVVRAQRLRRGNDGRDRRSGQRGEGIGVRARRLEGPLLVLVFERDMHKWLDDASARAGRRPLLNQLDRFFNAMLDGAADAPELTLVFMRELPFANHEPEIVAAMERTYRLLTELIDAAKARRRDHEVRRHQDAGVQPLLALFQLPISVVGGGHAAARSD